VRYGLTFRPKTTSPNAAVGVRMRPSVKAGTETKVVGIEIPAPCASVFAGYSADGNVDLAPGAGPLTVQFQCGGAGTATITAHGIFCPDDVFDWSLVEHYAGTSTPSTPAGSVDVDGNPTLTVSWASDPCADTANFVHARLRKNGVDWGSVLAIVASVATCADIATMPGGYMTFAIDAPTDVHFDITLLPGYTGTLPGDITWHFQQVYGGATTYVPTITADGPSVADGFTLHVVPADATDVPNLYGVGSSLNFDVDGIFNCTETFAYGDSLSVVLNPSMGVTDNGVYETVLAANCGLSYSVNHSDPMFSLSLAGSIPSVGAAVSVDWTVNVSSGGSPDFSVSPTGFISGTNPLTLSGTNIGGTDPVTIDIQAVVTGQAANTFPHGAFSIQVQSI
jgi:hypothetical protein